MRVTPLDKDNDYFEVAESSVTWWTAKKTDTGWHVVNQFGRVLKSGGSRWSAVVRAISNFQKMLVVQNCLGSTTSPDTDLKGE